MVFLHASRADVVRDLGLCVSQLDLGKSSYMKVTHRPLFGDGILKSSGEAWAYQRRLIAPELFPDKVRGVVDLMVGSATALVGAWEDRISNNRSGGGCCCLEFRIDDDIRAYSGDVISRTCFGSSYVKGKEIFAMIRELQKTVSKPNILAEMTGLSFLPTRTNRAAWRLNRQDVLVGYFQVISVSHSVLEHNQRGVRKSLQQYASTGHKAALAGHVQADSSIFWLLNQHFSFVQCATYDSADKSGFNLPTSTPKD
ncbi:hypothetical protein C2845_PM04G34140 [Panicum miliaceum]|uniref:Uncharacterized protein n=1 Tax=Panicum miliaceum TaxID=4540 RepID=A0A3L6QNR7_PANMI|nr:hypothetical protein C2845_PM04G34140 [Panicum miliaceum]